MGVGDDPQGERDEDLTAGLPVFPGKISVRLLRTRPGVTLGSALVRRPGIVERIRRTPGIGEVRLSRVGGTIGPGGDAWLSLHAVAGLPDPCPRPLDQLTLSLRAFFAALLPPSSGELAVGRVEGAWCPGFSDLSLGGRKLVGLGMRISRGLGVVRGVVAVRPPGGAELRRLDACHRLFGEGVERRSLISLAELEGLGGLDREAAIRLIGRGDRAPEKMSR